MSAMAKQIATQRDAAQPSPLQRPGDNRPTIALVHLWLLAAVACPWASVRPMRGIR